MSIADRGSGLVHLILGILLLHYRLASSSLSPSFYSCSNSSIINVRFGQIHSLNFYAGQSHPPNVSCTWTISNPQASMVSNYIISLRVLELEYDLTRWSNELTFWTGSRQISVDDVNRQTYMLLPLTSSVQISLRTKAPSLPQINPYIRTSLRIRRFALEFISMSTDVMRNRNEDYFRCAASGILLPKQWKCNCINECPYDDHSDEDNCPLCAAYEPSNRLLCNSNELWCLPAASKSLVDLLLNDDADDENWMRSHIVYSQKIDPKGNVLSLLSTAENEAILHSFMQGVCIPRGIDQKCAYSTNSSSCQTILALRQDRGQLLLDNLTLNNYQTSCVVIIAKDEYKIKLLLHQHYSIAQRPDLEWIVYEGSEQHNRILVSSNWLPTKESVQTRERHIVTIIVRQRAMPKVDEHFDDEVIGYAETNETRKLIQRRDLSPMLLNITWSSSVCQDDQMLCDARYETKCYTSEQRCDGMTSKRCASS